MRELWADLRVGVKGARTLSDAAIAYDLWLVQQDADGELVTDRYKVTAKQGQQVDYFFKPLPNTAEGRRSDNGTTAILMNVSGAIRGRVRTDGNIDLTVDGSRSFTDAAATAATAMHCVILLDSVVLLRPSNDRLVGDDHF